MSASPLPTEYVRKDWPRLVAAKVNGQEGRIAALEAGGGGGPAPSGSFTLDDGTASASGVFSFDDGGA